MTTRELDAVLLRIVDLLETPSAWRPDVEAVLRAGAVAPVFPRVRELGPKLGVSPKNLERRFRYSGLPRPRDLLAWGRVLRAMAYYAAGSTVERAAFEVGVEQSSLSQMVLLYAGTKASGWKAAGGDMDALTLALVQTFRARRAA